MKILLFAHTNDEPTLETGVTAYNLNFVERLAGMEAVSEIFILLSPHNSQRFENISSLKKVKYITLPLASKGRRQAWLTNFLLILPFSIFLLRLFHRAFHPSYAREILEIEKSSGPFDFAFYSVWGIFPEIPLILKAFTSARVVSVIHDTRLLHTQASKFRQRISLYTQKLRFKRVCSSSDLLLAPSQVVENDIRSILPNSNVIQSFSVPRINAGIIWAPVDYKGTKYIYYPNTFINTKNHHVFLEVLMRIEDINLVLSGSGRSSALGQNFFTQCRDRGLENRVFHEGFVSEERKFELMAGSLLLVMPTIGFESFSLAIWEAFAIGCPVLASNDSDLPEQVLEHGWYCNPRSPKDIGASIRRIRAIAYKGSQKQEAARDHYEACADSSIINETFMSWLDYENRRTK